MTTPTMPASVPPWDRTRWDRLQAAALVGTIALISSAPAWAILALMTGHVTMGVGQ